jgi:hypothetical protein
MDVKNLNNDELLFLCGKLLKELTLRQSLQVKKIVDDKTVLDPQLAKILSVVCNDRPEGMLENGPEDSFGGSSEDISEEEGNNEEAEEVFSEEAEEVFSEQSEEDLEECFGAYSDEGLDSSE